MARQRQGLLVPAQVAFGAYARGRSATRGHGGRMCLVVAKKE